MHDEPRSKACFLIGRRSASCCTDPLLHNATRSLLWIGLTRVTRIQLDPFSPVVRELPTATKTARNTVPRYLGEPIRPTYHDHPYQVYDVFASSGGQPDEGAETDRRLRSHPPL